MASVTIENVKKVYDGGYEALHSLNLDVKDNEFMVLVGPSGCGKTTALRLVAGLEDITAGQVRIDGEVMNDVPPKDRDIAMVFQNYALYPHMTVAANMGFALRMAGLPKRQIAERVQRAADILGLSDQLERKPGQLSGGQRQRVAMGRAITRAPRVFLMDEPLSNLDAKLRTQMRAEVLRIQRQLGVGTLYVTHDQTEAMTMGDRVAVLRDGDLQQCDTPQGLFFHPANLFVAAFIGSPAMNLFEAGVAADLSALTLGSQQVHLSPAVQERYPELRRYAGQRIIVGLRPEDLTPVAEETADVPCFAGRVDLVEAMGSELVVHFQIDAPRVKPEGSEAGLDAAELDVHGEGVARIDHRFPVHRDEQLILELTPDRLYLFDPDTGLSVKAPS